MARGGERRRSVGVGIEPGNPASQTAARPQLVAVAITKLGRESRVSGTASFQK